MDITELLAAHQKGLIDLDQVQPESPGEAFTLSVLKRRAKFINDLRDPLTFLTNWTVGRPGTKNFIPREPRR